jgi:hypothetical protein
MSAPFSPIQLINQSGPPVLPRNDPGINPYAYSLPEGGIKAALDPADLGGGFKGAVPEDVLKSPAAQVPAGLLGIWEQIKAGAPIAGVYALLAVLFVVGVVMLLSGSRSGQTVVAVVGGGGGKRKRYSERDLVRARGKGYDQAAKDLGVPA